MTRTVPDLALLRELCLAPAPSGDEQAVAEILRREFRAVGLEPATDRIGNVWAGVGESPSVAVVAHMDEVGLVVRRVEPDGFLRVVRLGGIGRRSLAARRVDLLVPGGVVHGVIGVKAHHLTDPSEAQRLPTVEEAYVDVGASTAEEVRALGVDVGTKAVFAAGFDVLGAPVASYTVSEAGSRRVAAKALDNRIGCLLLVELARRFAIAPPPTGVALVAPVREEFDLQGSPHVVRALRPDVCVVIDVTPASCPPDLAGHHDVRLGGGPALKLYDFHGRGPLAGYLAPGPVVELVSRVAAEQEIPLQREALVGLVTDASSLVAIDPLPTLVCLSLPVRYTHSPIETCDVSDLAGLIALAAVVAAEASSLAT